MAYTITLYKDGQSADITDLVSNLSWSENMDTVGLSLNFTVPDISDRYITRLLITAGDVVTVNNDEGELIRAVVINVSRSYPKRTVKASDYGFYLNKNDVVIQFTGQGVSECLKSLFSKVGVTVGTICDMPAEVEKVYIDNVKNIIDDLIEIQSGNDGKEYYYELRGKAIYVFQLTDEVLDYTFKPAENVAAFDVTDKNAHSRGKYTHSIENLKNRVTAVVGSKTSGEMPSKQYTVFDDESISKYGLLAENYTVNSDDEDNIESVAENELKEKNTLKRTLTMDFIGYDSARPGRVMHIEDEYLGINGNYRIESANHKINGGIHTMTCTLKGL